jgi:hypothetical protein
MSPLIKKQKIAICFSIALTFAITQFVQDKNEHERFRQKGKIAIASATYARPLAVDYAYVNFTTDQGERISYAEKCGSKSNFDKEYTNLKVLYLIDNPSIHKNYNDFISYSINTRILFFFFIYLGFLTFFFYMLHRNITKLYQFFRIHFIHR